MTTVAALYVDPRGCYAEIPGVDVWDEQRDARRYAGPHPVVAHPPCSRWCQLVGIVEARHPHLRGRYKGQDGGCFQAALEAVRRWGGVLEHPAHSKAWAAHGLNAPPSHGGWVAADFVGGWTCQVAQSRYGHRARKHTWLYAHGVDLPSLEWGEGTSQVWMTWLKRDGRGREMRAPSAERQSKRERNATPPDFARVLLDMARTAQ